MRTIKSFILTAGCVAMFPAIATAGEVVAKLIGEAGPAGDPQFKIALDGKEVGTGTVSPSVPTGLAGGIHSVTNFAAVTQTFTYQVPDAELLAGKALTLSFLNDSANATTKEDANLYVAGLSVDGVDVPLAGATIATPAGEAKPSVMVTAGLGIYWTATASFPVPTEAIAALEAKIPTPAAAPPAATCTTRAAVTITDFANNGRDISAAAKKQLDTFAAEQGVAGCNLKVVGYASTAGRTAVNQSISQARAQSVADYLKTAGFTGIAAEGVGETQQFGAGAANRRVIVTVVKP